jgi:hypothetical protein
MLWSKEHWNDGLMWAWLKLSRFCCEVSLFMRIVCT